MRAKYLGLDLPSPIIVSSSPYTSNVKSVEQCAASGAGAVVLKSIFEEQILHHAAALDTVSDSAYGDAEVYLQRYLGEDYKAGFLRLVQEARSKTELPVKMCIRDRDGAMFDGYHSPSDSPKYRPIVRTDRAVALALPWAE